MEWTKTLKESIDYIEKHLLEDVNADIVAEHVHMSPFYFQKGFSIVTGYTIGDYIRNRRLYQAALDLLTNEYKVIEVALKYGYETPESFSKAFKRFHGVTPNQVHQKLADLQSFQPLVVKLVVEGGRNMNVRIEKMDAFKVVGRSRIFNTDTAFDEIPKFWEEFCIDCEKGVKESGSNNYGMYGIVLKMLNEKDFIYLIAGDYKGNPVAGDFEIEEIPAYTWAKFRCLGPIPGSIQATNSKIFKEWLPGNDTYRIAGDMYIEVYPLGDNRAADYEPEIWIPVKEK